MAAQSNWKIPRLYGNQKAIKVKRRPCNSTNYYTLINLDSLNNALTELNGNAFKLWMWFTKNKNDYCFALSGVVAQRELNIGKTAYDRAIKELIDKKFLRKGIVEDKIEGYLFIEAGVLDEVYDEELAFLIKNEATVGIAAQQKDGLK